MAKKLPKRVFVYEEQDGDNDTFLSVNYSANGLDANTIVGIYDLVSVQKVVVTTELVEVKVK